jgi:tetraacyldisaccharide 4'-kinase
VVETVHRPLELVNSEATAAPLQLVKDRPVAAFCGIGNPAAFRRTLTDLGGRLAAFRAFPDHHAYTRTDVDELRDWARSQAPDCAIVTSQKDLVKLRFVKLGSRELWALRIGLQIELGKETLDRQLRDVVSGGR